ncbi:MAG TPA: TetR/AcrR family transcriptional regulator [Pyrinomonadaceae bacterium]|jgi:AcrR family transcriptional regulator
MTRHAEAGRGADGADGPAAGAQQQPAGRMCADDRRLQIVRVALRLFSERGFRGTTTKEIAQAAGVSEAIIFRHFATKDDLYTAIIDYKGCAGLGASPVSAEAGTPVIEKVCGGAAEAMEAGDDRAVFEGIALSMLEHHRGDPEFLRLLMYLALENHSLAQVFWDTNVRVLYEFLADYIRRRQREGAFRDVEPKAVVRVFVGSIIHHSLVNLLWDRDPARRIFDVSNEEAARQFAEVVLRGVKADPGGGPAPAAKGAARRRDAGAESRVPDGKNNKKK